MKVCIPNNNIEERKYIIDVLLRDFLQIPITYEVKVIDSYILASEYGELHINDDFWKNYKVNSSYLNIENLPHTPIWLYVDDIKKNIPFLYGNNDLKFQDNYIYCGADIFASAFFMLSRWEEILLPKDQFGRCDENEMFVVKHGLEKRPLVNEYVELLQFLLEKIGVDIPAQKRKFTPFITHDVDGLFRYANPENFAKCLMGDIFHRHSLKTFGRTLKDYSLFKRGKIKDPYDTFDALMELSESINTISRFYFMPTYNGEYDARYDIRDKQIIPIIENILNRGHEVGIHPGKTTFHNKKEFTTQVNRLREIVPQIKGGRQHYLFYDLTETLRWWDEEGLKYDAGLGFCKRIGFRCGCCYSFPVWDCVNRKKLNIIEHPLIFMDSAYIWNHNDQEIKNTFYEVLSQTRKYSGEFVFLWHSNIPRNMHHKDYLYDQLINMLI